MFQDSSIANQDTALGTPLTGPEAESFTESPSPARVPGEGFEPSEVTPEATEPDQIHPRGIIVPITSGIMASAASHPVEESEVPLPLGCPQQMAGAASHLASVEHHTEAARKRDLVLQFRSMTAPGPHRVSAARAARALGVDNVTITRWVKAFDQGGYEALLPGYSRSGRKPKYDLPPQIAAMVKQCAIRLDSSEARGRGAGSSPLRAFQLVALSGDERVTEDFRRIVLDPDRRSLPPSWISAVQVPASVLDAHRDSRSTGSTYISTPRSKSFIDQDGEEQVIRAGHSFQSDDGTLNIYSYIDWPFGGDKCSERYGVKLGRWQFLPVVDVASLAIVAYDVIARPRGSYRAEDVASLLGRTMIEIGKPLWWALERGSWESNRVTDLLKLSGVTVKTAWESKHKAAVEGSFNRLWTPMSMIPGHVGRDRARFKQVEELAQRCQAGNADPREHFLALEPGLDHIDKCVEIANSLPVNSPTWGSWIPKERLDRQLGESPMTRLDPQHAVFFAREIRSWKMTKLGIGGRCDGPLLGFPVHFQHENFWQFEGCQVKAFFDPYADQVRATVVLEDAEWRGFRRGHVIARDVPETERPPMAVLAEAGTEWKGKAGHDRLIEVRKAAAKSVRTEKRNYLGKRGSETFQPCGSHLPIGDQTKPKAIEINSTAPTAPIAPHPDYERDVQFSDD